VRKDTLRKMALALPEAIEQETWGQPTFRVRKKIFVMLSEGEREAWVKSTHDEQRALIFMDPETFYVPPYVGPSGWVGVWLDGRADWDELAQLLRDAYRLVAPKRLLRALDEA
jgi:predicted DNA-binding protein (MmcQ/YjbR family)